MGGDKHDVDVNKAAAPAPKSALVPGRITHFVTEKDGVRAMIVTEVLADNKVNGMVCRKSTNDPVFIQPLTDVANVPMDEADTPAPNTWHFSRS